MQNDRMLDTATIVGYLSGFAITVAYVPQVVKAFRTRSTRDLSIVWLAILVVGDIGQLAYGAMIASLPLVVLNIVLFILTLTLLAMKLKFG
ncbi:MAG: hypothetical protein KGI04_03125 [Candidatus Micrarchaeota archaeon]|nr:hypothetical protein [Candidatus Micrarchaeota archaeon]